jgi:hypothetical protein
MLIYLLDQSAAKLGVESLFVAIRSDGSNADYVQTAVVSVSHQTCVRLRI